MKLYQTRLIIYLIIAVNLATTQPSVALTDNFVPDECSFFGTIVMPETDFCGPYILLDNGLKIRPNDTMLTEINYRVKVGFEVVDSSCGDVIGVHLTCLQFFKDTSCYAFFSYEKLRCGPDSITSRCPGNTYRFKNRSGSGIDSVLWNFDDGSYSSEPDPTHSFPNSGIYNICLTIYAANDCQSTSCKTLIIHDSTVTCKAEIKYVSGDSIPHIFDVTDTMNNFIYPGFPAWFGDISHHEVVDRLWEFGDGTTSSDKEVFHFYRNPGIYKVCLTITTEEGCTDTECIYVKIGIPDSCSAGFSYREADVTILSSVFPQGYSYIFMDESIADVDNRIWIINQDSLFNDKEVYYTFPAPGEYIACLIIYTLDGCVAKHCKTIQVNPAGCDVDFTYNLVYPDCGFEYTALQFKATTESNPISYRWSFCDSTFSEEPSPVHFYKTQGNYTACLTVVYNDSCETTKCKSIIVPKISIAEMKSNCGQVGIGPNQSLSDEISVFPNPADKKVNFIMNSFAMQNVNITLIDILGQVRKHTLNIELSPGENQIEIDIQDLPAGNYFYIVSSPAKTLRGSISVVK